MPRHLDGPYSSYTNWHTVNLQETVPVEAVPVEAVPFLSLDGQGPCNALHCDNCSNLLSGAAIAAEMTTCLECLTCSECGEIREQASELVQIGCSPVCSECRTACAQCDSVITVNSARELESGLYCDACVERCGWCRDWHPTERLNQEGICTDCAEITVCCERCEARIERDDSHYWEQDEQTLCESCYYEATDEQRDEDDEDDNSGAAYINDYGYKPSPEYKRSLKDNKSDKLFFGLEVETEVPGGKSLSDVMAKAGFPNPTWYLKRDGSLTHGVELVSHPGTYRYWQEFDFEAFDKLRKAGVKSYQTTTCGLHIHVSRRGMSRLDIFKLLKLFRESKEYVKAVSRRKDGAMEQWARVDRSEDRSLSYKAKYPESGVRYEAINTSNRHTIEFRVFRGTLNKDSIRAIVSWVYALIRYVQATAHNEICLAGFQFWIRKNGAKELGKLPAKQLQAWLDHVTQTVEEKEESLCV